MRRENFLKQEVGAAAGIAGTVLAWNRLGLQAIRAMPPVPALRALAVLHTCMYNAWAAYDDHARQTLHGAALRLPASERCAANRAIAVSHAAHAVLAARFPLQRAAADACMAALGLDPAAGGGMLGPAGIGRWQAAAMLAYCRREGAGRLGGLLGASPSVAPAPPPAAEPAHGRWFLQAQRVAGQAGQGDDQDLRLFFALANALAEAALRGGAGAAAGEVLRRFAGAGRIDAAPGQAWGRQVGARVFDAARRHWEGSL